MVDQGEHLGLRERKKQATRRALQQAALRLAVDRGIEQVTVEDICDAVGVSVRTFFNYFSSKEEALEGDEPAQPDESLLRRLADGDPAGEAGLHDDLRELLESNAAPLADRRDEFMLRRELVKRQPALMRRQFARFAAFERSLVEAIGTRTDTDPDDLYPQLIASIAGAAMRVAMRQWAYDEGDRPLKSYIDEVFDLLSQMRWPKQGPRAATPG